METGTDTLEEKLETLMDHLHVECAVFEKIIYKHKSQHRRSPYFQYLLKVRRDLRLLELAKLREVIGSCFLTITEKKPKQKVHLLDSLKWKKSDTGKPNFLERLLGAARLLSQMVEPILKAASGVSILLARSFFINFCLAVLALLGRLRVLVQQILLEVVSVFNTVSSISQKKQSVKIIEEGIEVYREFYPQNDEYVTLECVWETDKYVLREISQKREEDVQGDKLTGDSVVLYECLGSSLGDENFGCEDTNAAVTIAEDDITPITDLLEDPSTANDTERLIEVSERAEKNQNLSLVVSNTPSTKPVAKKVAFVSVKRPLPPSAENPTEPPFKKASSNNCQQEESFYNLLLDGSVNDSLF